MMQRPMGRPVNLTTERFFVRSLMPADASDRWCDWSGDAAVMGPLNIPVRRATKEELKRYIARFDNDMGYLMGVFTKAMSLYIGFYMIEVNKLHATGNFNLVIGADPELIREHEGPPEDYFSALINRASNRYTLAVRCLYSASPLFLWIFDRWFFLGLTLFWGVKFIGFQDFAHVLRRPRTP